MGYSLGLGATAERRRFHRILQAMETRRAACYVLDSHCVRTYRNPARDDFAKSNGAPQVAGEAAIGLNAFAASLLAVSRFASIMIKTSVRENVFSVW